MNDAEHRQLREMLGAGLLGGLAPDEQARLDDHLETCAQCRAERDLVRPVARELTFVRRHSGAGQDPLPEGLGDRVLTSVATQRASRGGRGMTRFALVAAGSAAVAASITLFVMQAAEPEPVPLEPVVVAIDDAGVVAEADLVNHSWGVEIKLAATGLEAGATYRVAIRTDDGAERPAGEFVGTGAAPMHCNLSSSVLRPHALGFVVVDESGTEVISSTFSGG